jgi:hypothetical protein
MRRPLFLPAILAGALALGGCDLFTKDESPTAPSPTGSLTTFAGTWISASAAPLPSSGCGAVQYTLAPIDATKATINFSATCAGSIQINGSGSGALKGETLEWSAQGVVSQGGVNCPFTFTNGKLEEEGTDSLKVTYSGTVCGIPVSGTEIVKRPT